MHIPNTPIEWVPAVTGRSHAEILELIDQRPIVAWFSSREPAVRLLQKVHARLGDDLWMITCPDGAKVCVEPTQLAKALRYLTPENGWTLCEVTDAAAFFEEALAYLES
jgi:hypothetical protein